MFLEKSILTFIFQDSESLQAHHFKMKVVLAWFLISFIANGFAIEEAKLKWIDVWGDITYYLSKLNYTVWKFNNFSATQFLREINSD